MNKIFKHLESKNFIIEYTKKHVKIIHKQSNEFYTFHESGKGFHPLRRWLKSNYNVEI